MKRRFAWIGWLPVSAIGVLLTAVYVAWLVAYSQLGRRPMPSMDDPKFIGGMSTGVYHVAAWFIQAALVVWVLGMVTSLVISFLPRTENRADWIFRTAGGLLAMIFLLAMVRYSPGDACSWILD